MQFLDDIILSHADSQPDRTAVVFNEVRRSYRELAERVARLSAQLIKQGVGRDRFVIALFAPTPEIITTALATFRVGGIYAPLDPDYPDAQLKDRIDEMPDGVIVTSSDLEARAKQWGYPVIVVDALPYSDAAVPAPPPDRHPEDAACIFFTSGSTGKPKGVLGSYEAVTRSVTEPAHSFGFTQAEVINSLARYSWSISMLELFAPLAVGGTCLLLDRMQALNLPWLLECASQTTAFHCPPALLAELVDHAARTQGPSLTSVRLVWYGGDNVPPKVLDRAHEVFPQARVATAYGCTEIFGLSHYHVYPRGELIERVAIGRPVASIEQRLVPSGEEDGFELFLGGPRVAREYRNRPELNEEKFAVIDGVRFFRTGDFVQKTPEGALVFAERKDSQVKIRGIRVELGEIEHHFHQVPGVRQAVVLAKENASGVKELHAFFVPDDPSRDMSKVVRQALAQSIVDYLLPTGIYQLESLPKTANFKLDRHKLLELTERESQVLHAGDLGRIARAWREAGAQPSADLSESFFDAGGDSLSAARLASLLTHEFGVSVEVADVFAAPTLQGQAERLLGIGTVGEVEAIVRACEGQRGLFFRELLEGKKGTITCTRYVLRRDGFDDELLRIALVELTDRFPTLRTTLHPAKGTMVLRVADRVPAERLPQVTRLDGRWSLAPESEACLKKQPMQFDLSRGPLIGATVAVLEDGSELLQLTAHHVASDDNSMGRLSGDFITLYDGLLHKRPVSLPPIEDDYEAFCREQHARIQSGSYDAGAAQLGEMLRAHLAASPVPLIDVPKGRRIESAASIFEVPKGLNPRFADSVAALSWALAESCGRSRFVFCAHVALRRNDAATPRVGMFVNLVPVFCSVDHSMEPRKHAAVTGKAIREAMARSDVPYEVVMRTHPELRKRGAFPFDAFVNELRFDNSYPEGYEDVVVRRSFATDANEINLSLVRSTHSTELVMEAPRLEGTQDMLADLGRRCQEFLARL